MNYPRTQNQAKIEAAFILVGLFVIGISIILALTRRFDDGIFSLFAIENSVFWALDRGFGLPIPFGDIEAIPQLNPFFLIAEYFTADRFFNTALGEAYSGFERNISSMLTYRITTAIGSCISLMICLRIMNIGWFITLISCVTYLFSGAITVYYLNILTITLGFHFWSFPLLLFLLNRVGSSSYVVDQIYWGSFLAIISSISFLSGHVGSFYVNAFAVAIVALVMVLHDRTKLRVLVPVALIIIVCTSWKISFVATEILKFGSLPRAIGGNYTGGTMIIYDGFIKPLFRPSFGELWSAFTSGGVSAAFHALVEEYSNYNGAKSLFWIGPVIAVAAVVGVFTARRTSDPFFRALVVALVVCMGSAIVSQKVHFFVPSFSFLFLGPASVLAILIGAKVMDDYARKRGVRGPILIAAGVQILCLALGSYPMISKNFQWADLTINKPIPAPWAEPVIKSLSAKPATIPFVRVLTYPPAMSQDISHTTFPKKIRALRNIADVNAVPFHIAHEDFWPHNRIQENHPVRGYEPLSNAPLLDVTGIQFIVTDRPEAVSSSLVHRGDFESLNGFPVSLFENRNSWGPAAILDTSAASLPIAYQVECSHRKIMCADFSAFRDLRRDVDLVYRVEKDRIFISFDPLKEPVLLFISQVFRNGWKVRDGDGKILKTKKVQGGFLGVEIPSGVSDVGLAYRPSRVYWARTLSVGALLGLLLLTVALSIIQLSNRFASVIGTASVTPTGSDESNREFPMPPISGGGHIGLRGVLKIGALGFGVISAATIVSLGIKFALLQFGWEQSLTMPVINNISFYSFAVIIVAPLIAIWSRILLTARQE